MYNNVIAKNNILCIYVYEKEDQDNVYIYYDVHKLS